MFWKGDASLYHQNSNTVAADLKKINVLLVDDSVIVAKRIHEMLNENPLIGFAGYALDIPSALLEINKKRPDVVLIDIHLQSENGLDLLSTLRADFPHIVTIMITSHGNGDYRDKCLKLGAHYFLDKATDLDDLESILSKIQRLMK